MLKIFILLLWFASHPEHVTLLSIGYSAEDKAFIGYLKIYYDDFIVDCKLFSGETPEPDMTGKKEAAIGITEKYLREKVQVFAGDVRLKGVVKDMNIEDGMLNINLVYSYSKKSKRFTVKNSILTDIYKDQSNLLIFSYGNFEEGIKLTSEKLQQDFKVK